MGGLVAGQNTSIAAAVVGNWCAVVLTYNVGIKVHQALARNTRGNRSHAVRRVADRTREAVLRYVVTVLEEGGITYHVAQVVALGAHAIGSVEAEVRIRKSVGNQSAGRRCLAELIIVLKDVRVHRTVRTIRPNAAELAIVVAVMAIGAEGLDSHQPPWRAVLVQHVGQQTGLRKRARPDMRHGMA